MWYDYEFDVALEGPELYISLFIAYLIRSDTMYKMISRVDYQSMSLTQDGLLGLFGGYQVYLLPVQNYFIKKFMCNFS